MGYETAPPPFWSASCLLRWSLELMDPFLGAPVSKDITVEAFQIDGTRYPTAPVINASGRFVWSVETTAGLPASVRYTAGSHSSYKSGSFDLGGGIPTSWLVRIFVRPRPTYAVPDGITAVRGTLAETTADGRLPVDAALIQLAWGLEDARWTPPFQASVERLRPSEAIMDKTRQFLILARLAHAPMP